MTVEELEIVIRANVNDALKGIKTVVEAVKLATEESVAPMQQIAAQSRAIGNQTVSSMQQSKSAIRGLGKEIQATTAQQELLLNKINDLKATLTLAEQDPKLFAKSEVLDMRVEVEKLQQQLAKLQGVGVKSTNDISKSVNNGVKSLRRFGLALFSIRGIYSAVSRVVAQFKQTDEGLRASQELTINAMGQVLAPVIKVVTNLIQYLVIGLALLIKMFTGFDALAKVTTRNLNKTSTAAGKLNKQLTAMDEITNIGDSGSTPMMTGLNADLNALEEFQNKIVEVQNFFNKFNVQGFVDKLKDIWNWVVKTKTK
jgi:archaellum component FlaC